jgi:hypothetical protein
VNTDKERMPVVVLIGREHHVAHLEMWTEGRSRCPVLRGETNQAISPKEITWLDGPQEARFFASGHYKLLEPSVLERYLEALRHLWRSRGGKATAGISTKAKRRSSAENGRLGGRPRKNPEEQGSL